ncbi:MAG: SHOCT domain-containing protein [Nitrospira sp.]|nr:SHOCT domain-containing protein [Nitrospira sp.]
MGGLAHTYSRPTGWLAAISLGLYILGAVALSSCSQPYLFMRTINEEENQYVRFQARYGEGQDSVALKFAHPVALGEAEWGQLLANVMIQEQKKFLSLGARQPVLRPAFDQDQRRYLAKYLAEGFQKARPDEWVVFYLSRPRESGVVEIDSGGFFVEGERLHLIVANYRQPVSMTFVREQIWNDPLHPAGDGFYDIVPQHDQTLQRVRRKDLTQSFLKQVSDLSIDYTAQLHSDVGDGAAVGTSIEDRLRILKRLRDEGVISEEQFRLKQDRLLERF